MKFDDRSRWFERLDVELIRLEYDDGLAVNGRNDRCQ